MSESTDTSPAVWATFYVVLAGLWIVLSDRLVGERFPDVPAVQTFKGLGFVVVTGVILYFVLRRYRNVASRSEERRVAALEAERRSAMPHLNPYPIIELDASGTPVFFSQAALDAVREAGRQTPAAILPPDFAELAADCLATGDSAHGIRSELGDSVYSWTFTPAAEIGVVFAYGADITDELSLERQLRLSQRMESVGMLAGGIAHDFNNILTVIKGNAQPAAERADGEEARGLIGEIEVASDRAAQLVRHLLAYSRQQVLQPMTLDLNDLVRDMQPILRRTIPETIEVRVQLAPDLEPVFADRTQIEQVVLNLVVNARDAMPDGGEMSVVTRLRRVTDPLDLRDFVLPAGRYVEISVTDTGVGMDRQTLKRIFDPFFTTKEPGTGTGLGLSTAYGIVKQSRGYILVESEPGRGTTFRLFFPVPPRD